MKRLTFLLALVLAACGPAWTALDPQVDAARLDDRLAARGMDAEGYVQSAWLCLLHGRGCDRLATVPARPAGQPVALEALWAFAWASDGLLETAPRLAAWHSLATAAASQVPAGDTRADRLLTAAVEAVARLGTRDRAAVTAWLAQHRPELVAWLTTGAVDERWRRHQALASLDTLDDPALLQPVPLQLALAVMPLSRRLNTGLRQVPDSLPPATGLLPLPSPPAGLPVHLPARDPGVYRLQARFVVPGPSRLLVHLDSPRPVRLWCDGRPIAELGPEDGSTAPLWLDLATGPHVLDAALAVGQNGQPLTIALVPDPAPPPAVTSALAAWHPTLDDLLAATRSAGSTGLGHLLEQFPESLVANDLAVQRADLRDPDSLPGAAVTDGLLAHWPGHADAQLASATHLREAGQPQLAWQMLERLGPPPAPADQPTVLAGGTRRADLQLERSAAYLALGLGDLAADGAELAVQLQPTDCVTLDRALQLGQDTMNRPLLVRLLQHPLRCPADQLTRAFAQSTVGQLDAALASLMLVQQHPHLARDASGFARLVAQSLHQPLPPRPPWGDNLQADLWQAVQDGVLRRETQATQAALQSLLIAPGLPLEARQKAIQAGAKPVWQPFVRDGEEIAQQAVSDALAQGAPTVSLLDQEIVQLLPDGGALRRVHQVVRVREDAAADAVGEVRVAEGADLELARTILADGSLVLPAETDDKETISLRAVSAGTTVEFAQVAYQAPDDPATGATRLPVFSMQSSDSPVLVAEYIVLVPDGLPVHLEASAAAGQATVQQVGAFKAHIFRRENLPRVRNEPRAVRPERVLPTIRAFARPGLAAVLEPWNEALAAYVQSRDAGLRAAQAWLPRGEESVARWQKLASRLALTVQHAHEGGMPGRPEAALQDGKGDRAALFYTMARQAGADACLVRVLPLARLPGVDPLLPDAPLDPDDYGLELVRLRLTLPGAPTTTDVWYDPAQEGGRLDHLRAGLRGRQGLVAGCKYPPADPRVTVPDLGEGEDRRVIDFDLEWLDDGRLVGTQHERLTGAMAASVRAFLRGNGGDRKELTRQLSDGVIAGAQLELLQFYGMSDDGDAITLAYDVTLAANPGRAEALDLELWPEQLGQAYATLPTRTTPLLFSHGLDMDVTVRVRDARRDVTELPLDVHVQQPSLRYKREVRREGDLIVLHRVAWARPTVVQAADYPEFAAALRKIDAADRVRLRRTP